MRCSGGTRGTGSWCTVKNTFFWCSTLLWIRLCNIACGTPSEIRRMKIAVPSTRTGGNSISEPRNSLRGIAFSVNLSVTNSRPRFQVSINVNTAAPSTSGNQPPCMIFSVLAENKSTSIARKKPVASSAGKSRYFQPKCSTKNVRIVVVTIVPVTAMPYAALNFDDDPKPTTANNTAPSCNQLINGI